MAPYEGVDEPELTVDEMPAPDAGCVFTVTNMVNGDYNDFTAWYHMQLGREFLSGASMTDVGRNGSFDDAMLYCFIKENDGYAIYNKAEGKTELTYVDGKVMNGADELTVTLARRFLPVNTSTGKVYRDENDFASTNKWRKCWKSDYEPQVVLTGSSNNMTTTGSTSSFSNTGNIVLETGSSAGGDYKWMFRADNNMFVSNYTFLAKKEAEFAESASITAGGEVVNLTTKLKRIEASLTDDLAECSFVQNGVNTKGVELTDCYVTISRILTNHNSRTGYAIFPGEGEKRRIPALACLEAGEHKGRLVTIYDYRHNGGDIGFYLSLICDVSPNCDCHSENDIPIIPNVGMLASSDPVALDQACADLCNKMEPVKDSILGENREKHHDDTEHDHFYMTHPDTEWKSCIAHAVKIGLGTDQYELVKI